MLRITDTLTIADWELTETFSRSSGPGGQNVNKVATAVQLRYDITAASLPEDIKDRLFKLARNRLTEDGVLIIEARRFRTQEQNRQDAVERLVELIRQASVVPKVRKATRPSGGSRLKDKAHRSEAKRWRQLDPGDWEDWEE